MSLSARQQLVQKVTPELYDRVRDLWIQHSKAEDGRDLEGLIATLAENCVYAIVPTSQRWVGHAGAREFYTQFLGAFPDVKFDLSDIVIGPQGVIEIARLTGTHTGAWAGREPTGRRLSFPIVIHFPWDPAAGKFAGENILFDTSQLGG